MDDRVEREITSSQEFFERWLTGALPRTEALLAHHFVGRLSRGFQLIDPTGTVIDLERLGRELWAGHGTGQGFSITAENIRCRLGDGEIVIATYHEWQQNAVRAAHSDNGRVVTAVFRVDAAAVNGLRWVHVQETWLPHAVVNARFGKVAV